jgi:hypothetical protein
VNEELGFRVVKNGVLWEIHEREDPTEKVARRKVSKLEFSFRAMKSKSMRLAENVARRERQAKL